jgi:hypothetical protein
VEVSEFQAASASDLLVGRGKREPEIRHLTMDTYKLETCNMVG